MRARRTTLRFGAVLLTVNLALAGLKTAAWLYTGSLAIQAEALNSILDTAYSAVIVAGLWLAMRPATDKYPDGYRRIEPIVSLVIAAATFLTATGLTWQAVNTLATQPTATLSHSPIGAVILVIGIIVKFGMYRVCLNFGERVNSPVMVATAVDNRNDILTAGAALAGVAGATLGYWWLDPIASLVVAAAIGFAGVEITRENIGYLLGSAPNSTIESSIIAAAVGHDAVHGVHDVCIYHGGPEVDVSMHLEVEGGHSVEDVHEIEVSVADAIRDSTDAVTIDEINLHVDPITLNEWKTRQY